jgi:glutamyl-tRNA reductase
MSVLAIGVSHRTAPMPVLERLALDHDALDKLLQDLTDCPVVDEAFVLATCNRIEIYLEADTFHAAVDATTERLARHTGMPNDELVPHLYVHYEDRAVQHLFNVTSGLDSMVLGEGQILGQVRSALRHAQEQGAVGKNLNDLTQNALRVGKRAHAETGIDKAGASLVSVGLDLAGRSLSGLSGKRTAVVGAGSMAALAATSLARAGASVVVLNRTLAHAQRLAASIDGEARPIAELADVVSGVSLLISCTGAMGHVVEVAAVTSAQESRNNEPFVAVDLALPRDIDPAVLGVQGVTLIDLDDIGALLRDGRYEQDVEGVRRIVVSEVESYLDGRHSARVAPTVVALRGLAAEIVARELDWFAARRPDIGIDDREDVEQLVNRVVDKLLHAPTVRVKELAAEPDGDAYAEALHRLFDLDLRTVEALRTPGLEDGAP